MTEQLTSLSALRDRVASWRRAGERVALVPTMGALHRGHLAVMQTAKADGARVVASIFVNPTQFGPNEDFHRYPRPLADDIALLEKGGIDAVWLPTVDIMYPGGFATTVQVKGVTEPLEGAFRPGHFDGVATVVAKLLQQVMPDTAYFGEKDYQQLAVIQRMVADLNMPIRIIGAPTVREADGLALSSRNRYLSAEERQTAAQLYAALTEAAAAIRAETGEVEAILETARQRVLEAGFRAIDYLDLRDPVTLAPTTSLPARLLVAAHLGTTRLIDNISVE